MSTSPNNLIFLVDQMRSDMTREDSPCISTDMNWFDYDELYDLEHDPRQMKNLLHEAYQQPVKRVRPGQPAPGPCPYLPPDLEQVRKQLITAYWNFAIDEQDMTFNAYFTAALVGHWTFKN